MVFRDIGMLVLRRFRNQRSLKTARRCFVLVLGEIKPLSTGLKLEKFDDNKPVGDWPWRELVGWLPWLANEHDWILRMR